MSARPETSAPGGVGWTRAVVLGLISGAGVVLVAEAVALLAAPASGPFATVGSLVIDSVPGWVKDAVISVFGTGDKLFLLVALAFASAVVAAVAGILESAWPPAGSVVVAASGVVMTAAAVTRADASGWAFLPPVVGTLTGIVILRALVARAAGPARDGGGPTPRTDAAVPAAVAPADATTRVAASPGAATSAAALTRADTAPAARPAATSADTAPAARPAATSADAPPAAHPAATGTDTSAAAAADADAVARATAAVAHATAATAADAATPHPAPLPPRPIRANGRAAGRGPMRAAGRGPMWGRRGFMQAAGVAAFGLIVVGIIARARDTAASSIAAVRQAVRLPTPRHTVAVPAGAQLDVPGITPLFTSNADFYRVDTALNIPAVDPSDWQLTVDGMVDHTVRLSFKDLLALGVDEYDVTLTCVSNEVGGDLIGNARWLGVPVRTILRRAVPHASADMVLSRSVDGFTAGTPLALLTDDDRDAILAVGMNGRPLPLAHGFPVRMVVPGLYGYVSATKWLQQLTVTTFATSTAYWTSRGYSAEAPVKMSSRIDTPASDATVHAGPVKVAGVAWAQPVGVSRVEVRIDDGPWRTARRATPLNDSTWVQWVIDWNATRGSHTLTVRAVDDHGTVQDGVPRGVIPNGATGWDQTVVHVA